LPRKRDDWLAYRELGVLEICRYYGGVAPDEFEFC
jgi:hypothetical protein